ncbi:hypothetical protein HUB95_04220 [Wolbachia endosymbiont of Ceratosolen solmsi]|uniref:hypothetical protein n=1 Tax=unclassified Wolbachia TaxID=2640676 RepID=UPI0018D5BEAD|nr:MULTISPECIES: hypothetical protein [unclassified Wolbachia]MBH5362123.1 hypothetical protein [Wolbachia endosymbiont of Kradibia gibbosae]QTP63190.1 hypothetical protein HUB95_04220 [Wolbachia endosymbiont of Ceratosolen solmsi]
MSIQQKLKIPNLFSMYDFVSVILETFSCHPSSVTYNCTNIVIWYNVKTMSSQCLGTGMTSFFLVQITLISQCSYG